MIPTSAPKGSSLTDEGSVPRVTIGSGATRTPTTSSARSVRSLRLLRAACIGVNAGTWLFNHFGRARRSGKMTLEARFPLGAFNVLPHAFSDCCAGAAEGVSMGRRVRVSRPEPQSDSYLPGNEEHLNPRADLSDEQTAFEVLPEEGMAQQNEWGSWGGRLRGSAAPATARGTPGAPGTPTSSEPAPDRSSL